jgi:Holliday junction resolvase-like predicted endonuclease
MGQANIPASSLMSEKLLTYLYTQSNKTDREIAEFFNIDRTYIVKARSEFGVNTRISTGDIGEQKAIKKLRSKGFRVKDMNLKNKLSPFDLLVNGKARVEIKSAKFSPKLKRYCFALSEQAKRNCVESNERITLRNGRTKKLFSKTCDFIIFVCIGNGEDAFYVLPSNILPDDMSALNIRVDDVKYARFKNNWELLTRGGEIR